MRDIYIHADDFGICDEQVNVLISLAERGCLHSLSAFAFDKELKEHTEKLLVKAPDIRIAVHLNVVEGPSVLGHEALPLLTDERGFFCLGYGTLLRMSFGFKAKEITRETALECAAQIEQVRKALPKGHLLAADTHQHTVAIPAVRKGMLSAIIQEGNIREFRRPTEAFGPYCKIPGLLKHVPPINFVKLFLIRLLMAGSGKVFKEAGLSSPSFAGVLMTDGVKKEDVLRALPQMEKKAQEEGRHMEVLFHPARIPSPELCPDRENLPFMRFNTSVRRDEEKEIVEAIGEHLNGQQSA